MKPILSLLIAVAAWAQNPVQQATDYMAVTAKDNAFMGTVLVAKDGKVLFSNGYGFANAEHGVLNTVHTKFRLGSVTKQFTALAILQLEEAGKLKVTDAMCSYVENCPDTWKPITIHQLLTHTSGIFNFTNDPEYPRTAMLPSPPAKSLEKVRDKPLRFPPGSKHEYSNTGYIALAIVVEKASGESYPAYMRKHVFQLAGMNDSGHDDHTPILKNRATGYAGSGAALRHAPYHDMTIPIGAGDLYSTAQDLLLWDQALYNDTLLKAPARAKLFTPEKNNYAYGWMVPKMFNRPVHTHGGGIFGFTSNILRFPEDRLVTIVLSNNTSSASGKIGKDMAAIFLGEKFDMPKVRTAITLPPDTLDRYIGKFALAPTAIMTITREGNQIFTQLTGQPKIEIYPESPTEFFVRVVDAQLTFRFGADGKATGITLHQNGRDMPAERVP
jgi:CubicO group peptidase (beta-lactamase class C family)